MHPQFRCIGHHVEHHRAHQNFAARIVTTVALPLLRQEPACEVVNRLRQKAIWLESRRNSDVFGLSIVSRFGLSGGNVAARGHGAARSLNVVRTVLPRVAPFKPMCYIGRATVQRATSMPSRRNCRHTFLTP